MEKCLNIMKDIGKTDCRSISKCKGVNRSSFALDVSNHDCINYIVTLFATSDLKIVFVNESFIQTLIHAVKSL